MLRVTAREPARPQAAPGPVRPRRSCSASPSSSGTLILTDTLSRRSTTCSRPPTRHRRRRPRARLPSRPRHRWRRPGAVPAACSGQPSSTRSREVDGVARGRGRRHRCAQIVEPDGEVLEHRWGARPSACAWFERLRTEPLAAHRRAAPTAGRRGRASTDAPPMTPSYAVGDRITVLTQAGGREMPSVSRHLRLRRQRQPGRRDAHACSTPATAQDVLGAADGSFTGDHVAAATAVSATPQLRDRVAAVLPARLRGDDRRSASGCRLGALSRTSWRSSASSCWSSPASRCSSAPSSSSTPSRCWWRSAPASSRCCARSARAARQVTRSVLLEAVVSALLGSMLGLGLGVLLSPRRCEALFGLFGPSLTAASSSHASTVDRGPTLVGVVVTVARGLLPARRASPDRRRSRRCATTTRLPERRCAGAPSSGAAVARRCGIAAWRPVCSRDARHPAGSGSGRCSVVLGVAMLSPVAGRPVVPAVGAVLPRIWGTTGPARRGRTRLRNPRRTAATASALMVGLALVGAVTHPRRPSTQERRTTRSTAAPCGRLHRDTTAFAPFPGAVADAIAQGRRRRRRDAASGSAQRRSTARRPSSQGVDADTRRPHPAARRGRRRHRRR